MEGVADPLYLTWTGLPIHSFEYKLQRPNPPFWDICYMPEWFVKEGGWRDEEGKAWQFKSRYGDTLIELKNPPHSSKIYAIQFLPTVSCKSTTKQI